MKYSNRSSCCGTAGEWLLPMTGDLMSVRRLFYSLVGEDMHKVTDRDGLAHTVYCPVRLKECFQGRSRVRI